MKIIIAPAKQMKYTSTTIKATTPVFVNKQEILKKEIQQYTAKDLHTVMKISFKMADEVYRYYQQEESFPAIHYYAGTVFKQLKLTTYNDKQQDFITQYLRILSAYYGVLSPYDAITAYRLDMTMKPNNRNLYHYWKEDMEAYFSKEDCIISLASKEFTSMIDHTHIITIDFVQEKAGKLVRNAAYVKKARGKMLHEIIKHQISTIEEIKDITFDQYVYKEDMSSNTNLVFYQIPNY